MQFDNEEKIKIKSIEKYFEKYLEDLVKIERLKLLFIARCISSSDVREELFNQSEKEKYESEMKSKYGI